MFVFRPFTCNQICDKIRNFNHFKQIDLILFLNSSKLVHVFLSLLYFLIVEVNVFLLFYSMVILKAITSYVYTFLKLEFILLANVIT